MNRPIAPSLITSVPSPAAKQSESRTIATGDGDNPTPPKIKLVGFDYVFAHRGHQYLAMETEKLDYFSGNQGIDRS
jgi:hypothetical protein